MRPFFNYPISFSIHVFTFQIGMLSVFGVLSLFNKIKIYIIKIIQNTSSSTFFFV